MQRCLALASVIAGCGFSKGVSSNVVADAPETIADAPADATPIDMMTGNEAQPVMMMSFTSVADLYLRTDASPNENTNDRDYFIIDGDIVATGVVRFDTSAIPTTAVVMMAEMSLFDDGDAGMANTVYPLLESWDEATATSNQRMTGVAWAGAGATPPSRGATAIGTFTPATANTTYTFPLTTAVVQGWVTTPATNFGVAIATTNSDGSRFASRERSTASQRPSLRVTFQP